MRVIPLFAASMLALYSAMGLAVMRTHAPESAAHISTFSIVARDPETGDLRVAVQSKYFAVGAVVPHAKADIGAIATQARANLLYGPRGLAFLATGRSLVPTGDPRLDDSLCFENA